MKNRLIPTLARMLMPALVLGCAITGAALGDDADGKPDLYEIKDADSSIYLMGTIHLLPPSTDWQKDIVLEKMKESAQVYFELDMDSPTFQQDMQSTINANLFAGPGNSLKADLGEMDFNFVVEKLGMLGIPPAAVDQAQPWGAAMFMQAAIVVEAGFDPNAGVDNKLAKKAGEFGKPVDGLEDVGTQIRALSAGTREEQLEFLRAGIESAQTAAEDLNMLVDSWMADDVDALLELTSEGIPEGSIIEQRFLTDRNNAWMVTLEQALADDVTSFVAVGALHLYGNVGLLKQFRDKGYTIVRH